MTHNRADQKVRSVYVKVVRC